MRLVGAIFAASLLTACGSAMAVTEETQGATSTDGGSAATSGDGATSASSPADAAAPNARSCDPSQPLPPTTTSTITTSNPVIPFYQWEANDGYCGETSMIQAGLRNGQWTSQYDARLLCGAHGNGKDAKTSSALLQTGPAGFCAANENTPDYNAQFLLESEAAANAATCLGNYRLAFALYDGASAAKGIAGYRDYMSWVKKQTMAGYPVTIGVLVNGGDDPQYDHIVSVLAIGANHDPTDATYYDDDVLYFDDHGGTVMRNGKPTSYTSVPPGAGTDTAGCTSYINGFRFADLPKTRDDANKSVTPSSILIPGVPNVPTNTGGDGVDDGPPVTGRDYAFAVTGPASSDALLPVRLTITGTATNGQANPADPTAGFNYENPHIGADDTGDACTNDPPAAWMDMTFAVTVDGLTAGAAYTLYEYDFDSVSGAIAVPTSAFNANASQATQATPFVASGPSFTTRVTRRSSQTIVFRAVASSAP